MTDAGDARVVAIADSLASNDRAAVKALFAAHGWPQPVFVWDPPAESLPPRQLAFLRRHWDAMRAGAEAAEAASGGKRVHFDRLEMVWIPDGGTAAAALRTGEIDWIEYPLPDLVPTLDSGPKVEVWSRRVRPTIRWRAPSPDLSPRTPRGG